MIRFDREEGGWVLTAEQWLAAPLEEVFEFFSQADNLQKLTPASLNFEIVTPRPIEMRPGTLIDYQLKLHGIPLRWRSEITVWEPPHRFVDVQVKGPYRKWIHTHTFEASDGGTQVRDHVAYAVPGGAIANALFVKRNLTAIFQFRSEQMLQRFAGADQSISG